MEGSNVMLRGASLDDVPAIVALLEAAHLPAVELEEHLENVVVAERDGLVVACGGIEVYGDGSGLIRSMAVEEGLRGSGLGRQVLEWVVARAKDRGVTQLLLFTMNAHDFYAHFGFRHCTLDAFPEGARRSAQYGFVHANGKQWGISAMERGSDES